MQAGRPSSARSVAGCGKAVRPGRFGHLRVPPCAPGPRQHSALQPGPSTACKASAHGAPALNYGLPPVPQRLTSTNASATPLASMTQLLAASMQGRMASLPTPMLLLLARACSSSGVNLSTEVMQELLRSWLTRMPECQAIESARLLEFLATIKQSTNSPAADHALGAQQAPVPAAEEPVTPVASTQDAATAGLPVDTAWITDVCEHVAEDVASLSTEDTAAFLTAAQQLNWRPSPAAAQAIVRAALAAPTAAHAAQLIADFAALDPAPPKLQDTTDLQAVVERVHGARQELDAPTVLNVFLAARRLGAAPSLSQFSSLCDHAVNTVSTMSTTDVIDTLTRATLCADHLPLLNVPLADPSASRRSVSPPTTTSTQPTPTPTQGAPNSSSLWEAVMGQEVHQARQSLRHLITSACLTLQQPQCLTHLSPTRLTEVATALQRCRYTQQPVIPSVGMGAGTHGPVMVNSYPVTVIHPSGPPTQGSPAPADPATDTHTASVPHSTASPSPSPSPGVAYSTANPSSTLGALYSAANPSPNPSPSVYRESSPEGPSADVRAVQGLYTHLHQAAIGQLNAFKESEELADFLRPMAAMRALPDRALLTKLATDIEHSASAYRTARSQRPAQAAALSALPPLDRRVSPGPVLEPTPEGAMSHHAMCMALFLLSVLGVQSDRAGIIDGPPLAAAQEQLAPIMTHLTPGDLCSAVWAFACLDKTRPPRPSRSPGYLKAPTPPPPPPQAAAPARPSSAPATKAPMTLAQIASANTANAAAAAAAPAVTPGGSPGPESGGVDGLPAWVAPALRAVALKAHVNALLPHQLAFIMGSLERAGCRIPMPLMDQMLVSFQSQLSVAKTGDTVLVLASVARVCHVALYTWTEAVLEGWLLERLDQLTPKEIATVAWSLARLHHRPSPEFLSRMVDCAQVQLSSSTADNLATFVWSVAELAPDSPVSPFLSALCNELRPRLGELAPRDLVSILSAMARLRYQPPMEWLQEWLGTLDMHLAFLDGEGYAQVVSALAVLDARVPNTAWWNRFLAQMCSELPSLDTESLIALAAGLSCMRIEPPDTWRQAFAKAVEGRCGASARAWGQSASMGQEEEGSAAQPGGGANRRSSAGVSTALTPLTAQQHEMLLASQTLLDVPPGPRQMSDMESQLAGVSALRELGGEKLIRLLSSLASVTSSAARHGRYAPLPRLAWLDGPFAEALRGALPDLSLVNQSQMTRALGQFLDALDARSATVTPITPTPTPPSQPQGHTQGQIGPQSHSAEKRLPGLRNLLAYLREFYLYNG